MLGEEGEEYSVPIRCNDGVAEWVDALRFRLHPYFRN